MARTLDDIAPWLRRELKAAIDLGVRNPRTLSSMTGIDVRLVEEYLKNYKP
jgi:hypothetical protein